MSSESAIVKALGGKGRWEVQSRRNGDGFTTREMQRIYELDQGELGQYFKETSRTITTECSLQMPHSEYLIRGGLSVGLGQGRQVSRRLVFTSLANEIAQPIFPCFLRSSSPPAGAINHPPSTSTSTQNYLSLDNFVLLLS